MDGDSGGADLRGLLQRATTATVASLLFQRGLRGQAVRGVQRLTQAGRVMAGPAFTLRSIPAREDLDVPSVFRDPAHPQRRAIEEAPAGSVLVIDSRGDLGSATAGGVLLKRLEVRGCAGVVTDGALRDADPIAGLDMPVYCAGRNPLTNLTRHHAVDLQVPIGCGEAPVYPGDWVLGDGDGVLVIPASIAREIAEEAVEKEWLDAFLMAEIAGGAPVPGTYPPSEAVLARYRAWRARQH
jgi:regulator of RNase E activity RraA